MRLIFDGHTDMGVFAIAYGRDWTVPAAAEVVAVKLIVISISITI